MRCGVEGDMRAIPPSYHLKKLPPTGEITPACLSLQFIVKNYFSEQKDSYQWNWRKSRFDYLTKRHHLPHNNGINLSLFLGSRAFQNLKLVKFFTNFYI